MSHDSLTDALAGHPFLASLAPRHCAKLAAHATRVHVAAGDFLTREGEPCTALFLLESGQVAIEVHTPARGAVRIQTIGSGDIVGWSWLVPPHRWQFDARAVDPVVALRLDAAGLRELCDQDLELAYEMLRRMVTVIAARLAATRWQLLDVYR